VLIAMIASVAHALAGDPVRTRYWAANVRERNPSLTRDDFFRAFPMKSAETRSRVSDALARSVLTARRAVLRPRRKLSPMAAFRFSQWFLPGSERQSRRSWPTARSVAATSSSNPA